MALVTFARENNKVTYDVDGTRGGWFSPDDITFKWDDENQYILIYTPNTTDEQTRFLITSINGRPSDDAEDVADWLRLNYFYEDGPGGGGGGDATSANQLIMISELQDIETDIESVNTNVNAIRRQNFDIPAHDERELTYVSAGNGAGEIENVIYRLSSSEVGRLTFTYDSNDDLTNIVYT